MSNSRSPRELNLLDLEKNQTWRKGAVTGLKSVAGQPNQGVRSLNCQHEGQVPQMMRGKNAARAKSSHEMEKIFPPLIHSFAPSLTYTCTHSLFN